MRGDAHVRFGGRVAETHRPKDRQGAATRPLLADPDRGGPLWLASVRDAFSRRIVGWKASDRADVELVLGALEYAVWGRGLGGQPRLIHHSDRGAQGSTPRSGSPNALSTPGSGPPWAASAIASTMHWRRTSSPP